MSMGRTQEKMLLKILEEKADVIKIESLLKEKEDVVSSLTTAIETKEYETNVFKKRMESLEKQRSNEKELFVSKVAKLEVDLKEKTEQGYEMYVQGFERAVSQVRVIAPDVDVSKMDVTKVVVNGVMVDDDIVGLMKPVSTRSGSSLTVRGSPRLHGTSAWEPGDSRSDPIRGSVFRSRARGPGDSRIVPVTTGYSWELGAETQTPSNTCSKCELNPELWTPSARDKGLSELQRTKVPAPSGRVMDKMKRVLGSLLVMEDEVSNEWLVEGEVMDKNGKAKMWLIFLFQSSTNDLQRGRHQCGSLLTRLCAYIPGKRRKSKRENGGRLKFGPTVGANVLGRHNRQSRSEKLGDGCLRHQGDPHACLT
ncbi:hypothetical protein PIB30_009177 [Stylosanthes scabra]|uniref:Uncharacterized protein n=1 Tax=Stylosanthes scabra TaxID=79078 RepID=A0ABU6Y582_9FABA|nr:hypothetical protein [Stylosanthes scabra]